MGRLGKNRDKGNSNFCKTVLVNTAMTATNCIVCNCWKKMDFCFTMGWNRFRSSIFILYGRRKIWESEGAQSYVMGIRLSDLSKSSGSRQHYQLRQACYSFMLLAPLLNTRNPASRASQRACLVAMYIAVAIRLSSYVHRVTSEAVSFLPEVVAQIWLDPLWGLWCCWETFIWYFFQ